jgi:hypothetical protein
MQKSRLSPETGSVFIQVLVAIFVLTGFSMFVVDYGVMWVSRNQAQNAADAGALAGAVALALDDFDDRSDTGPAKTAARSLALATNIFGSPGDVNMATDILFYPDDPSKFPADCVDDSCIRVDVYRNQARSNPLPMFFGMFVGVNQQGVRATATAWAGQANASDCLKPWGVADKWEEHYPITKPWEPADEFTPVVPPGFTPDRYIPPDEDGSTSFTVPEDVGHEIRLKLGSPMDTINPGWFQALDFAGHCPPDSNGSGADCYRDSISGCSSRTWKFGDLIPKENGNMVGPTGQGTQDLIDLDPNAEWDGINKKVIMSCTQPGYGPCPGGKKYAQSPRIVAIPIFDLQHYLDTGGPGNGDVRVVNILGFFVDRIEPPQNTIVGYLAQKADIKVAGGGSVNPTSSFLKVIQLVR